MADEYDIRLGPLTFAAPIESVGEALGDGLDAVGASLIPGERRPQPIKLKLIVRGAGEGDLRAEGVLARKQVRQLLANSKRRLEGLFFYWAADPDIDCWLKFGGGELNETERGLTFGEWALDLTECYVAGRPGTHRPGRRAQVIDLTKGEWARDSRGLLYVKKGSSLALPAEPIFLPGDAADITRSGNQPVVGSGVAPERGGRHLWRSVAAVDGDVFSYVPDRSTFEGSRTRFFFDEYGSVRVWDLEDATWPPNPTTYSAAEAEDPTTVGWEQLLGQTPDPEHPLAMDNGLCRLVWLGFSATGSEGLVIERYDETLGKYVRHCRVVHSTNVGEQRVVEATTERAVLEWRSEALCMRAVLQRGWPGPKIEVYNDGGGNAILEYQDGLAALTEPPANLTTSASNGIDIIEIVATSSTVIGCATHEEAESVAEGAPVQVGVCFRGGVVRMERSRVMVLAFGPVLAGGAGAAILEAAGRAACDARPIPVLIDRH